jgi:3-carboxy-cis,cis-muconate cycloisomerase
VTLTASEIQADAGLLAPVWVGTLVEAAVCDHAWLQAMLDAEAALARAQARLGTVPRSAAEAITNAARADRLDLRAIALGARETANPVVALVGQLTRAVAADAPAAAPYVHQGSTSQDIFDTGAMLVSTRALRLIQADLCQTAAALADLAARHSQTPMAGRTLALHAVPTTFGLKAAGWRQLVLDAHQRLSRLADGGLPVSLGGAAGTLAGYLEYAGDADDYADRLVNAFAAETGLARPVLPWHALRTPIADLAAALAFTAGALGKIAVDVQVLARTEVGEVAEPTAEGRGSSSAMPHKRNPVLATLIRCAALQVPAIATGLTQCLIAEDERSAGAWHAEWLLLRECLRLAGGAAYAAAELATGLRVIPERMRQNLDLTRGQVVSERLVAVLAPMLGKAEAKQELSGASAAAELTGSSLSQELAGRPRLAGLADAPDWTALCDPTAYTGAAQVLVDRALRDADDPSSDPQPTRPHGTGATEVAHHE